VDMSGQINVHSKGLKWPPILLLVLLSCQLLSPKINQVNDK
jgi:hypothetical protein